MSWRGPCAFLARGMTRECVRCSAYDGKVYAVDISAKLMQRLAENANEKGLRNIETVVCSERSVDLPANSVDLVFVCDTYHHFEFPRSTLRSIYDALKPGGQLVVVDFYRIAEKSRPWVLWHVRAGEEVVTQEIIDAGFELINTPYVRMALPLPTHGASWIYVFPSSARS